MDCKQIRDLFSNYIEQQLDEKELIDFEKHMKECEECGYEFYEFEKMILKIKQIKDLEPPGDLKSKIMAKVIAEENRRLNNKILNFRKYFSVAATFLVIFVGFAFYKSFYNDKSKDYSNLSLKDENIKSRSIEQSEIENLKDDSTVFRNLEDMGKNLIINLYSEGIDIIIKTDDIESAKNFLIENIEDTKKFEEDPNYLEFVISKAQFLELLKKCEKNSDYKIEFQDKKAILEEIEKIINEKLITEDGLTKFKAEFEN